MKLSNKNNNNNHNNITIKLKKWFNYKLSEIILIKVNNGRITNFWYFIKKEIL